MKTFKLIIAVVTLISFASTSAACEITAKQKVASNQKLQKRKPPKVRYA